MHSASPRDALSPADAGATPLAVSAAQAATAAEEAAD